jgi:catechol 2,3-dioxygenase-like lactoylglutathione lyase family enzyme
VLGRFLEFSIATRDIRASLNFYNKLGFSQAEVGEAWTHPYAVVSDGRIVLGLHQHPEFISSLTFVKPDLLKHLRDLERTGLTLEFRRLGNDVFNEIGWFDPAGHLIRLVEARTFSPPKRPSNQRSSCGYFVEMALPAPALDEAKAHWEQLGFVGVEENEAALPHLSCTSDTLELGLYDPADVPVPTLLFEIDDLRATLTTMESLDVTMSRRIPAAVKALPAMLINAPEGTPILMTAAPP